MSQVLYKGKNRKIPIKSVKMKISKNKTMIFSHVPRIHQPKNRFLGQKVWSVARLWTDTHTDKQTHTKVKTGHPFRVSGIFPSTYRQGSAQQVFHVSFFISANLKIPHVIIDIIGEIFALNVFLRWHIMHVIILNLYFLFNWMKIWSQTTHTIGC